MCLRGCLRRAWEGQREEKPSREGQSSPWEDATSWMKQMKQKTKQGTGHAGSKAGSTLREY